MRHRVRSIALIPAGTKGFNHRLGWVRPLGGITTTTAEDIYPSRLDKRSFFVVSSVGYNTTTTYWDIANNNNVSHQKTFKPLENYFLVKKVFTANIFDIQQELINNNERPINSHNIATVLRKRNILRQTKTIQISTNLKFVSTNTMELFCWEPLTINDSCQTTFTPD